MTDPRIRESYRDAATVIAACLALGACSEDKPERTIPVLDAEYAGCAAVYAGPVCTLTTDARELVFWAEVPRGTAFRVRAGEEALAAAQEFIEGGVQIRATIPESASEVVLERMENNEVASAFKLPIRPDDTPTEITEALALRGEGKFDEAEAKLAPLLESDDELVKTRARSTLARIELSQGNHERAGNIFEETSDKLFELGAVSLSIRDSLALAHIRTAEQWRLADATATLAEAEERTPAFPFGTAGVPYDQAKIAERLGDARRALALLEVSLRQSRRLGLDQLECLSTIVRSNVLDLLGRDQEALDVLNSARGLAERLSGCDRADYYTNLGWMQLADRESQATRIGAIRSADGSDPTPALETALSEYMANCPRSDLVANAHVNLAFAALQQNDFDAADDHLARARERVEGWTMSAGWATVLEARLSHRRGQTETALSKFGEIIQRAEAAGALGDLWRALVGRAQLFRDLARDAESTRDLERAEAALDELTRRIAVGDGRESFAGDRDLSARLLVDALVAAGDANGALVVARRARRRALQMLHRTERLSSLSPGATDAWTTSIARYWAARTRRQAAAESAWTAPGDELEQLASSGQSHETELARMLDEAYEGIAALAPSPAADALPLTAGVVELRYFPAEREWIGFVRVGGRTRAVALGNVALESAPAALSDRLLEPFRAELSTAATIEFVTYGPLDLIDFGSLPWEGRPLLESKSVAYRVDLGSIKRELSAVESALVVSDPRGDLPEAAREGTQLTEALEGRGIDVDWLTGREAHLDAVVTGLGRVDLLHFAGHGRRQGHDEWRSSLGLAGDDELSVGDVLALRSAPQEIVLAACDVGATNDAVAGVAGMNLARAFVAADAQAVVAALEPVPDDLAAQFSLAYYRARATQTPEAAFRTAALQVGRSGRVPYRLFVP